MGSFKQMIEPVLVWLRGDYNSVRYRFLTLPREEIKYAWYRLTGRTWLDFYTSRLNAFVDLDRPVSEAYLVHGEYQAQYLLDHGLKPDHYLLDYGCGILRLAYFVLPYLPKGHYVGVDIAEERLAKGRALLAKRGIHEDAYRVVVARDCKLLELKGDRFDYVWAKSVFTHMPLSDIEEMLVSLRPLLKKDAQFFFTFSRGEKYTRKKVKDFYYTDELLRSTCQKGGYHFEIMDDWDPKIRGDVMVRLRPS